MADPHTEPDRSRRRRGPATSRSGALVVAAAGLGLLLLYVGLSFVNDVDGTLSTDVGGKLATLRVMEEEGTTTPAVGYWAAEWDPDAVFHGLFYTSEVDGRYVNVTTVPVIELAHPLFDWGGHRAALAWSMLGGVAAAFAARALARRAGGDEQAGWAAFALTGLASPVLLYALDLWEHAPGVALMAWSVVAVVDLAAGRPAWLGLAAGAGFGLAFSMRTEAAVYGFVVVAVGCVLVWRRSGLVRSLAAGAAAAVGFGAMAAANAALEVAVLGGPLRAGRSSGAASGGGDDAGLRLKEAITTTFGLFPSIEPSEMLVGVLAAVLLGVAVWRASRDGDRMVARVALGGAVAMFVLRAVGGLGFVPGMLAAAPFGVAGLVLAVDRRVARPGRDAVLMVVCTLPLVWLFQYSGGAGPQWGGRYVLTTGLVAAAVGIGASGLLDRWVRVALVALSVAVTAFGLGWMVHRTHEVGRAARTVAALDGPVVSVQDFWLRELGAVWSDDTAWLSTTGVDRLPEAVEIVDDAGERSFTLLWVADGADAPPPEVDGWTAVDGGVPYDWLGADFRLTRYQRSG